MAVTSATLVAPFDNFESHELRPAATLNWVGGTGPFDILYEWDDNTSFTSPITDTNLGVTGTTDTGIPPSDMGPAGTDWYVRATITDTDDFVDEIQTVYFGSDAVAATVTASHEYGPDPIANINDGDPDTNWNSGVNQNAAVIQIDIDCGAAVTLDRIRVLDTNCVSLQLYWSDDGSAYTSIGTFSGLAASGWEDMAFSAISHRYWRIEDNGAVAVWMVISEIELRSTPTAGTFRLDFDADQTLDMNWDESLAGAETELEGLTGITDVDVTGTVSEEYIVEFVDPGAEDVSLMTVDDNSLTPTDIDIVIVETLKGASGTGEQAPATYTTIQFSDVNSYPRFLYVAHNIGVNFGTTGVGDGNPDDFFRYLYANANVGVGFGIDPYDDLVLGDGDPDLFSRYLYANANVDANQPCPYVSSIAPTLQTQGAVISVYGDGFGATQATYITEVRLYEDQDLGGAYVVMAAGSWSDEELSVTIPAAATTGWVALVQTNGSATCFSSVPKFLQVEQVPADPDAGWWLRTANKENVPTEDHTVLPGNNVSTSFRKIMNSIGSGRMEIPLGDPVIDTIIDPTLRQGTLVQTFIDDRMRYGWFAEDLSHDYNEEGDVVAVISGRGMEVVALWAKILPQDAPASPTKNATWVYGSNENFVQNPGFEDDLDGLLQNPGGEEGNNDEGDVEGWSKFGDDLIEATAYQIPLNARTGDWYIQVEASGNHAGIKQSVSCEPGKVYHVRCYIKDETASGYRVTLSMAGATDLTSTGTYANNYEYKNVIYGELDNVARNGAGDGTPGGSTDGLWQVIDVEVKTGDEQTSIDISIQDDYHTAGGLHGPFWIDDVEIQGWGLGLEPWEAFDSSAHASNSFRLSEEGFGTSAHSCDINPLELYAGIQQVLTLNALTKYTFSCWIKPTSVAAGDSWSLAARRNDGSETLIGIDQDVVPVAGQWNNMQFVAETPNLDEVEIFFRLVYTGSNNPPHTLADDFAIVPGEPAATAGKILNDVLDKMALSGKLLYLIRTFTDDLDSRGQNWPSSLSMDISPSESLYGLLSRLVALGHEWEIVPVGYPEGDTGFELNVFTARSFNPETGLGQNLVKDPEGPVIMPGDATVGGRIMKSVFGINTVMAIGDDGVWSQVQQHPWNDVDIQPGDPAPHGYDESFGIIEDVISVSASDATTVAQFAEARLADIKDSESILQIYMQRSAVLRPFLDFNVGDSIFVDMPPSNPDPPVDDGAGGFTRLNPQRIRSIQAALAGEGSDINFQVDVNRVVYEDELGWYAMIAQLAERSPADNTGQGTGSVSGVGGAVSVIGGGGTSSGTVEPHTHSLKSSEIKDKVAFGDVSGTLPGTLQVQAIKGVPVDTTVPTEIEDQSTALVYNYDAKVLELQAGIAGGGGGGASVVPTYEVISFKPGGITDIPDNADPAATWADWPNATVSQTITTLDGKEVLVDATMFGTIKEPDVVIQTRIAISLDDGATWDYGEYSFIKYPSGGTDRFAMSNRHTVAGIVDTNIIIKAQYFYNSASNADAENFTVEGFALELVSVGGDEAGESTVDVRGSSTSINTTTHSLTIPGGQAEGDIMFVFAASRNSTIGTPSGSGWTSILSLDTASNEWVKAWWKIASASEATVTVASSAANCSVALVLFYGQQVAEPFYHESWLQSAGAPQVVETLANSFTIFYYLNAYNGTAIYDIDDVTYTKELSIQYVSGNDAEVMVVHRDSMWNGAAAPVQQSGGRAHQYQVLGVIVLNSL